MNIIRETERVKVVVSCKLMSFANLRLLDLSVHLIRSSDTVMCFIDDMI